MRKARYALLHREGSSILLISQEICFIIERNAVYSHIEAPVSHSSQKLRNDIFRETWVNETIPFVQVSKPLRL